MAKTFNGLFEQIYTFDAMYAAYLRASKRKRFRNDVLRFKQDLEGNLIELQNQLIYGEYKTGKYYEFPVYEPKLRLVAALPFRDRVVHHSLVAAIEPIFESRFISDSYACRIGKGMHKGADKAQQMLRSVKRKFGEVYVLKADIAKYFYSISHNILKKILRKYIRCKRTLKLLFEIIDSTVEVPSLNPIGIPIGSLTSQLLANVYLHVLDLFVKHVLKVKNYIRYMDDFVIIHHDKDYLHDIRRRIEEFLWGELQLKTNAKTQVFPVGIKHGRALDFLGYRIWTTHRRLRKSSINRITRKLRWLQKKYLLGEVSLHKVNQTIQSWLAHASYAETYGLRKAILGATVFRTQESY